MPTTGMSQLVILVRTLGLNVWFTACLPWYNNGYGPKGWDDSNRLDGTAYRSQPN